MNNTDKQGLRNSTVAIKSKIIVKATTDKPEIVLTDDNSIKDWEYTDDRYVPQQGFIGQFVARTLSGNLQDISDDFNIENREIELQLGIVHLGEDSEPSWYSFGNFIITNPEGDEVRDNTKFEAMDYAKLFNKTFDGGYTDTIFTTSYNTKMENKETVTALWLAQYVCAQVNIELGNTDFVNSDYVIDINPFRNNETCRDVIKEVAKLAYSWVRIDWDNKCYIDFSVKEESSVDEYNIFTSDHYYTLETKKEKYGPINNVVIGMSNVDGESHSNPDENSIAQNGEHAIYIYDNPLTYTFEHRESANAKGNCLFGLSYAHMTCETIGFPWLRGNELIGILDMENNPIYTYPFNKTITFNGHIKSTIDSMGESEVEETLAYESNVVKDARNAFINVNKQEGEIHILSQNIQNVEKEINPPENASGSEIIVEDASNNPLLYLEVEGKSTQETRSGKNLLNLPYDYSVTGVQIIDMELEPGTYTLQTDEINLGGDATRSAVIFFYNGDQTYAGPAYIYPDRKRISFNINEKVVRVRIYSSNNYNNSQGVTTTYKGLMLAKGYYDGEYEAYGVSPSPDYPSEIESVGYENLVEHNTISNLLTYAQYIDINSTEQAKLWWDNINNLPKDAEIIANWDYTSDGTIVSDYSGKRIIINYSDSTTQTVIKGTSFVIPSNKTITYINVYGSQNATSNKWENIIFVKGTQAHSYIPYGKYGIEVETGGKNLFDISKISEKTYLESTAGNTGTSSVSNVSDYIRVKANKTYILNFDYESLANSGNRAYCFYDENKIFLSGGDYYPPNKQALITPTEDGYIRFAYDINCYNVQFEKGTKTTYQPYQNNTLSMILNSPLKSLPNGVKDIAYIKNNRLYVDHYVGSVVLNGSESGWLYQEFGPRSYITIEGAITDTTTRYEIISTHYKYGDSEAGHKVGIGFVNGGQLFLYPTLDITNVEEFKTWLSTNNVQVDYELAEPYTEEIGEIETLKTLLGYNKITTTDDLQPTLNITYVRDTVLADYVENHIAELKINEEQISQRVETIDTSVDGLQTDISKVEQITTDNSQVLNIISTHIDKTTGEVREVTTTTGFTFNAEGSSIKDSDGFEVLQTPKGAYYKDNGTITGQYTKDGSKQKDLELFGTYSYGKKDIDDTPMFVGQLYTDENGDEGFGHFVNI